jgi:imidazole glycerol-phosphate synthase subunit HisH
MTITIIDYGSGNLLSVSRALEHCGATCQTSGDPAVIAASAALVLPGVGAFRHGMEGLAANGLIEPILAHAYAGRPLLGICLGMQMLASSSEEFGSHQGLGLIPGKVREIASHSAAGVPRKTPFIGWASIDRPKDMSWEGTPLQHVENGESVYLVHSYHLEPKDPSDLLATYNFDGDPITAAVRRGNITGLQFHPEKSGRVGLCILREFVILSQQT